MIMHPINGIDPTVASLVDAAEAGSAQAAKELGDKYRLGNGVERRDSRGLAKTRSIGASYLMGTPKWRLTRLGWSFLASRRTSSWPSSLLPAGHAQGAA